MTCRTHIVIADRGWILEKLAKEIADRSKFVTFDTNPDPSADLQYYVNYSCRRRRVSLVELAFFTHSEQDEAARKRFFDIAQDVEHSVCMSKRYEDELTDAGVENITTITPGVDLDRFQPKIRVGVIGRTYHTGRKGEALVADLMELPGIEWRFTGHGWPGESTFVPDDGMPDFYTDLDYVLVPALYEGGPMSVLEGLACGVPIISSDVGWVNEYPHISFENGDSQSLRNVLSELVKEKRKLRESVEHRTWRAWGESHLELFEQVAKTHGIDGAPKSTSRSRSLKVMAGKSELSAFLMTHGGEGKTLGGPSVRVPKTAEKLAELGVATQLPEEETRNFPSADIVHIFNTWPVESAFAALEQAKQAGKTTVFSPIFLNLTHMETFARRLPAIFAANPNGGAAFEIALKALHQETLETDKGPLREPFPGYHERVRACVSQSDHVIYLSKYEKECLDQIGATATSGSLVHNPVDSEMFTAATGELFKTKYDVTDYILCVGRIEARKNQLLLALAARELNLPIVFIGHDGNSNYAKLVRLAAGENAKFIARIDPSDATLASAFAGARVFCLPSWSEGAPLAALEAGAAGANLVLSSLSSESEYFSEFARFAHPADLDGLKTALQSAWIEKRTAAKRKKQVSSIAKKFSWETYAENTLSAYEAAHRGRSSQPEAPAHSNSVLPRRIYVDLTTTWHHVGHPTGIARVETECYRSLLKQYPERIQPIVWNSNSGHFLKISVADSLSNTDLDELARLENAGRAHRIRSNDLVPGARLVNFGGAWIRNGRYVNAVRSLKTQHNLNFSLYIYDLIQLQFKQYYPKDASVDFSTNLKSLARVADDFLVCSDTTRQDLLRFLLSEGLGFKAITRTRLGDMSGDAAPDQDQVLDNSDLVTSLKNKDFVIYVSSLDLRKNHTLLVNVWRRLIEERRGRVPSLLFVGRNMWRGDEIVHQIESEGALKNSIHILDNVDDHELKWLYQNALFSVYPSYYEGWGLPVAESLSFGTPCLASNRSSVKEISPQLTDLLDPYDFRAWVDKIKHYLENPSALENRSKQIRESFEFIDWDNSVQEMVTELDALPFKPNIRPVNWTCSVLDFSNSGSSELLCDYACGEGWGRRESAGRWGLQKSNSILMRVKRPRDDQSLKLRIVLSAFPKPSQRRQVSVLIAGQAVGTFALNREFCWLDCIVNPVELSWDAQDLADIEFKFDVSEVFAPCDVSASSDRRTIGPLLQAIAIANTTEQLDRLLPKDDFRRAQSFDDYMAEVTANRVRTSSSARLSGENRELLAGALAQLEEPKALPPSNIAFRIASFMRLDRLTLAIHRKIFARTNDSLRRIITVLSNPDQRS